MRDVAEAVHLAVAAVEQEAEDLVRQVAYRRLACRQVECVREAGVAD